MGQAKMSDIVMNKKAREGGGVSTIVSTPKHKNARGEWRSGGVWKTSEKHDRCWIHPG
jgi:hypothetical protein